LFTADPSLIKEAIEKLIEDEFIERDKENIRNYIYRP
jgi:predicted transcriptional regulator